MFYFYYQINDPIEYIQLLYLFYTIQQFDTVRNKIQTV